MRVWFVVDFGFDMFVDFNFVGLWFQCAGSEGLLHIEGLLFVVWHKQLFGWVKVSVDVLLVWLGWY